MDGAILFSDILILPHALGQRLTFREGKGPVLEPIESFADLRRLKPDEATPRLEPVFDAVRRVAETLDPATALIGFAGSPWTVATYMVEGGASKDFRRVKSWAYREPDGFGELVNLLVGGTIELLASQMAAGAEVIQLFDSWAGILPEPAFERWVIEPTRRIVSALKSRFPDRPVIGFPRGAGLLYERYITETGVDGIGLDTAVPVSYGCARLQPLAVIQGNLDPTLLLVGGATLETAVRKLCRAFGRGPFVFNLGHGVLPETPPENVKMLGRLLSEPNAID
jgi:uroporphyrinogen decarboxylase